MKLRTPFLSIVILAVCTVGFTATAIAEEPEFTAIANHLKKDYHATERHIPFMGLAYFAVKIVRPAGVKSFKIKIFENLKYSHDGTDEVLNAVLQNSLGPGWQALVKVYSRSDGQQTFVYSKEEGKCFRIMVVNIGREDATVVKLKVNPDTLVKWIDNPKILGISLGGSMR